MRRQKTAVTPAAAIAKYRMAASILSRGLGVADAAAVTLEDDDRTGCVCGKNRVVGEGDGWLYKIVVANT